ncbi:acetyl-CoA C-acetyltransferase (plasmid) [Ensifer sp. WSM1721]|uniref:acetyl-CoA C-acetyltransferase n=1 Tax=Ensifer sp. WSM1721 TaxID=1041159 RepID=UPI000A0600EE|nr:acetyl-CoA C-acetyltransferase [Ensifer sp. WSM1721]
MAKTPNSAAATKATTRAHTAEATTTGKPIVGGSSSPNRRAAGSDRPVYLVDGARTPFLRARNKPGPFTPVDLAVQCGRPLLMRLPFSPDEFDAVILGCVNVIADEMNPARVAALRLCMGTAITAFTVQINCGSGMQSIDTAFRMIETGKAELILAGGAEALSHAPLVLRREAAAWFGNFAAAKSPWEKTTALALFRPEMAKPVVGLERGLTDPITELNMGQTAEVIGHLFGITREAADAYALESHQRLAHAQNNGLLDGEVIPAISRGGMLYDHDDGVRPDTSMDKLAKLDPVFEKPYGNLTAGNSSQITDGACWVVLASEEAMRKHELTPLARIIDSEWSALDPSIMGLAPTLCSTELMKRRRLSREDIDLWELNEAFAAQVLACLAAWQDEEYCRDVLGLDGVFGGIERDRLNVDGGAISLGHPVGTSGNRLVLHLVKAMRRLGLRRGIATECIGGGQGGAMLLEVA